MFLLRIKKFSYIFFILFFFCFSYTENKQSYFSNSIYTCFLTKTVNCLPVDNTLPVVVYTLDNGSSFETILREWNCTNIIVACTDNFHAVFDLVGGDLVKLNLLKYKSNDNNGSFSMLDCSNIRYYYLQSSVLKPTEALSTRVIYKVNKTFYSFVDDVLCLNIDFVFVKDDVIVTKRYVFNKNSYLIAVNFFVENKSSVDFFAKNFYRIVRKTEENKSLFKIVAGSFTGAAVSTVEKIYKKIFYKDLEDNLYQHTCIHGWAAMVERYFISAWLPQSCVMYYYVAEALGNGTYSVGFSDCVPYKVSSNTLSCIETLLYVGPTKIDFLQNVRKGLELSVDYGMFWPVSKVLFTLLCFIHKYIHNWGFSIIVLTILIKSIFYPLTTVSYRSMRNIRKLQPQIDILKKKYSNDRKVFGSVVMELYKKESINPLSGFLPMLVQIPVFISLYYVLLEAIELRKAPFIFWIQDLSAPDPFFVLPIVMGVSMYIQQKLTSTSTDEIQGKIMLFLPFLFTFLFLNFPSGLMLYWIINNSFSILQQWYILYKE